MPIQQVSIQVFFCKTQYHQLIIPSAVRLLDRMIDFNPFTRMTVTEALAHSWLADFHVEEDEPDCPELFADWEDVEKLDSIEMIRAAIMREIGEFRDLVRSQSTDGDDEGKEDVQDEYEQDPVEELKEEAQPETSADSNDEGMLMAGATFMTLMTTTSLGISRMSADVSPSTQGGNSPWPTDTAERSAPMAVEQNQDGPAATQADHSRRSSSSVLSFASGSIPALSSVPLPQSRHPSQRHGSSRRLPSSGSAQQPATILGENGLPVPSRSGGGSSSRKSSTSMHRRNPSSFFFGGGMTAITADKRPAAVYGDMDPGSRLVSTAMSSSSRLPSGVSGMDEPHGSSSHLSVERPKSRVPSLAASEFGALRPIIRGLSAMDLDDLQERVSRSERSHSKGRRTSQGDDSIDGRENNRDVEEEIGDGDGNGTSGTVCERTVLMPVSPNDAPPSPVSADLSHTCSGLNS